MTLHVCEVVMFTFSTFAVEYEVIHLGNDIGARTAELHANDFEPWLVCFHFRQSSTFVAVFILTKFSFSSKMTFPRVRARFANDDEFSSFPSSFSFSFSL